MAMEMKTIRESRVKPAEETRRHSMPFTLLDRVLIFPRYNSSVYIYKPTMNSGPEEFAAVLRESLSKTLVRFYPIAGRCRLDNDGILELDCNDEGVPFVEAEADSDLEALGDLAPSPEMSTLLPHIDNTQDISSFPLLAVQVTYFKCGGVSVGVLGEHHAVDGSSAFNLIKSWSEIARGLEISTPPFLDRTSLLCPSNPPQPKFDHHEYSQYGATTHIFNHTTKSNGVKISVFGLTKEQIDLMKATATTEKSDDVNHYSTFEILAGHIWKGVCKARGIGSAEETRLMFPVDARFGNRWKPELPRGFFGNAVFRAVSVARVGDLESEPLGYAAAKIHEALVRMDDVYLRSTIDYLALLPDNLSAARTGPHLFYGPNFQVTSWAKIGLSDADFGWGPPIYTGPGSVTYEKAYIFPSDRYTGGLSVAIALQPQHMEMFENIFYAFEGTKNETKL